MTKNIKLSSLRNDRYEDPNGEWKDSAIYPGVSWLVRSNLFPDYQTARDIEMQRLSKSYGDTPIPGKAISKALGPVIADNLLLGWKGLDVEYSREQAREILGDFGYRRVLDDVERCAMRVGEKNLEFVEDLAKN